MRIAINCRSILLSQRTGIGRYTYHLLDSLGEIDPVNDYVLHTPKRLFDFKRRLPDSLNYKNLKRYPDYFKRGISHYDIYHLPCPDALGKSSGNLVVTIHDLIYKAYPQSHTQETIELTDKYMKAIAAKADKIICISENTRRDLHTFLDIPTAKSCVIYNGVEHKIFYPLSSEERMRAAVQLKEIGIDKPYILYVGTIEPRKNLVGLLESFAMLKAKKVFHGQLVVVGMKGWMVESTEELVKKLGIAQEVDFLGFISDELLARLYNMAELFVFPSFYEGFGFPILEAFCCGTPVIASNTSSCNEIATKAALTVDPHHVKEIAQAMEEVLTDRTLKESLRQAGLRYAQEFSFAKMAKETLGIYQQLYKER